MTKSVIKSMDVIQQFGTGILNSSINYSIDKFVLTGHSKRGWVAWLTGILDSRVTAIIPISMPVLNIASTILKQYQSYGTFSFAIQDYINNNITSFLYKNHIKLISDMVDPINFLASLKRISKYIILGSNDEFFPGDSTRSFFNLLPGESKLSIIPNTNHNGIMFTAEISNFILNFYKSVKIAEMNSIKPKINWEIKYSNDNNDGTIIMNIESAFSVESVLVWSATTLSTTKRHFRMYICGTIGCKQDVNWISEPIQLVNLTTNQYSIKKSKPISGGWIGFFIQVTMKGSNSNNGLITSYTTEMAIVPNTLPFDPCPISICGSGKLPSDNASNSSSHDDDSNHPPVGSGSSSKLYHSFNLIISILSFLILINMC